LKGKSIDDALTIDNMDLVEELSLPPVKIHCSVLAEDAIKSAINDYRNKQGLQEIKFEDIFNDEKRESVKQFILENKQKNRL
jgi:nitrogen fixation NifU-like protein